MNKKTYTVIIVGGGPAGLSLAYMLRKLNINYLVIEKGTPGNTWFNMPDALQLLSPLWTNLLAGSIFPLVKSYQKTSAKKYAYYLSRYTKRKKLVVCENTQVINIDKEDSGQYSIQTSAQEFTADIVVCASGYFSNPYKPKWEKGNDHSIEDIHSCDYRNPEQIRQLINQKRRILIVGSRISAGQIMLELYDSGFSVSISHREKIEFRGVGALMSIKEFLYFPYEAIKMIFRPYEKRDSSDFMVGGKAETLILEKKVTSYPTIREIRNNKVDFIDNSTESFDLIIYATGYQPTLDYINNINCTKETNHVPHTSCFESTEVGNLFFIGFDNIKNFRSRYLRGIKSDSKDIALIIQNKLKKLPS